MRLAEPAHPLRARLHDGVELDQPLLDRLLGHHV